MKKFISIYSLLLLFIMIIGGFFSCKDPFTVGPIPPVKKLPDLTVYSGILPKDMLKDLTKKHKPINIGNNEIIPVVSELSLVELKFEIANIGNANLSKNKTLYYAISISTSPKFDMFGDNNVIHFASIKNTQFPIVESKDKGRKLNVQFVMPEKSALKTGIYYMFIEVNYGTHVEESEENYENNAKYVKCKIINNSLKNDPVTINVKQDSRVYSLAPNSTAPNATYFSSSAWTWNGDAGYIRSLLQFDLSVLPVNATILSSTLYLYHHDHPSENHSSLSNSNESYLQRVTSSWSASTVNWNNQPATTTNNQVTMLKSASPKQDYIVDVTSQIKDMVNTNNYGFMIRLKNENQYARMQFSSSDTSNAALRPKLIVHYEINP